MRRRHKNKRPTTNKMIAEKIYIWACAACPCLNVVLLQDATTCIYTIHANVYQGHCWLYLKAAAAAGADYGELKILKNASVQLSWWWWWLMLLFVLFVCSFFSERCTLYVWWKWWRAVCRSFYRHLKNHLRGNFCWRTKSWWSSTSKLPIFPLEPDAFNRTYVRDKYTPHCTHHTDEMNWISDGHTMCIISFCVFAILLSSYILSTYLYT